MTVILFIEKVINEIKYTLCGSYFEKIHKRICKKKEIKYVNCSSIMFNQQ